jgi:hypothetical protein
MSLSLYPRCDATSKNQKSQAYGPTLTLDTVTNYEHYKGLYSSYVDRNYYEIAYALNRQFGENGLYRQVPL